SMQVADTAERAPHGEDTRGVCQSRRLGEHSAPVAGEIDGEGIVRHAQRPRGQAATPADRRFARRTERGIPRCGGPRDVAAPVNLSTAGAHMRMETVRHALVAASIAIASTGTLATGQTPRFEVTYTPAASSGPVTGRLVLIVSR